MRRVLITGATGFVGRALTDRLLRDGFAVTALSRNTAAARGVLPPAVQVIPWNPEGGAPPLAGLYEGIVHLAGESLAHWPWSGARKKILWNSRVSTTRRLVEALAQLPQRPAALITASGLGYYGDAGDRPVRPGDPAGGDFLGRLAQAWESEARAAERLGMRVTVVRLGMVIGKGGGALSALRLPFRAGLGAVLGSGRQYAPWIHRDDAASLFAAALRDPGAPAVLHGAAGIPVTQHEFAIALARALRRPLWLRVPEPLLRLGLGEMADLFLHGQRAEGAPGFLPHCSLLQEALRASL